MFVTVALGWSPRRGQAQVLPRTEALVIGELDSPTTHVFGSIAAVEVNAQAQIFVLDGMTGALRWFDPDGAFRSEVGGMGGGPGEFRMPVAIALSTEGTVHVLDPANMKISRFISRADSLTHVDDRRTGPAFDYCMINERRFILYPSPAGIIHEIDSAAVAIRSFGNAIALSEASTALPPDLRLELLNRGDLACDTSAGRLLVSSERTGLIASFAVSGERLWQTELSDFYPARWVSTSRGGWQMAADPSTGVASTVSALTPGPDGTVVVTVHEGSLANPEGRLVTRVLHGTTGRQIRAEPAEAAWVAYRTGTLYGIQEEPYPRVISYRPVWR
jgi:hypothetical protein